MTACWSTAPATSVVRSVSGPAHRQGGPSDRPTRRAVADVAAQLPEDQDDGSVDATQDGGPPLPVGLETGWARVKMTLMTVNNHSEQGKDHRTEPRWSAGKKADAVLRLLRGESLEELSRALKVEAHRLAAWRDDFLAAGKQGLKGQRSDRSPDDRALKQAERKVGQLTLENEVLRAAAEQRGLQIPPAKRPR